MRSAEYEEGLWQVLRLFTLRCLTFKAHYVEVSLEKHYSIVTDENGLSMNAFSYF